MIIKSINALGLYGGASLNSIEVALITTDGLDVQDYGKTATVPYPEALATDIRAVMGLRLTDFSQLDTDTKVQNLKNAVSEFYAEVVAHFTAGETVDIIGIDGLTVGNDPANHCCYQIENGCYLSRLLQRRLVTHFHKADLLSGGQASPLLPAFINTVAQTSKKPALFINLDVVSSLIYLGATGELIAFDCAPGVAMIEDWTFKHANMQTDYNGKLAVTGHVHRQIVQTLLKHKILHKLPPKSLDAMCFADKKEHLEALSLEDGAATATCFIAEAVYQAALDFLPKIPADIYVSGEGVKNPSLLRLLKQNFAPRELQNIDALDCRLTSVGAQATAYNAVRRLYSLPITFQTTTGAYEPMTGGEIYEEN